MENIKVNEKKKMIQSLLISDSYYECALLCELFKDNTKDEKEKDIYTSVIKICKTTQDKEEALNIILESKKKIRSFCINIRRT